MGNNVAGQKGERRRGKKLPLLKSAKLRWFLIFMGIFAVMTCAFAFFEMRAYYERRETRLYLAENQIKLMDSSLTETMSRVYTLRWLVMTNHGETDFFDKVAKTLYEETAEDTGLSVKNFILAPGGIVKKIFPMEGNEALVGFDYLDETQAGNAEAVEAYRMNKVVLTHPFPLKQGGNGVAARLPIFLNTGKGEEFWGMVAVTLDMDYLLEKFNLDYLKKSGIDYCLWYYNQEGERIVLECSGGAMADPVSAAMTAHNLTWILDVEPEDGWLPPAEICLSLAAILLVSLMFTRLLALLHHTRNMNSILEEIAIRDNLTGCYSRHYVSFMLLRSDSGGWRDDNALYSMAVIDVDEFKRINDTFGHDIGDQALVAVSDILMGQCDELRGDCVIRYGGDEFIFLMNHVMRELFESRLKSILEGVRAIRVPEAPDLRMTVSIGAVMDDRKSTYHDLFFRADKQIYLAKREGRNHYRMETTDGQSVAGGGPEAV